MLRILFFFLLLCLGIVLGPILVGHQGRVLIQTDTQDIVLSITALVLILTIIFIVLFILEALLRRLWRMSSSTHGWFIGRRSSIANKQTKLALLKMIEGDYQLAEDLLTRNAEAANQPVVNYLLAAQAAHRQNNLINTNRYIERATELAGSNQLAVDITRIRIQLENGAVESAKAGIDRLLDQAPRHPEVLALAEKIYTQSNAFQKLLDLLPSLRKTQLYNDSRLDELQFVAYQGLIKQAMATGDVEMLKQRWQQFPRRIRNDNALIAETVSLLINSNDSATAEKLILHGLKNGYDERLILLVPKLHTQDPSELEKQIWKLTKQHGATPLLNSTLGQLLLQHGNWQSASEQFNQALAQRPDAHDYALLAETYDKLEHPQDAAKMREEGLRFTLKQPAENT